MKRKQAKAVAAYVWWLKSELKLDEWRIDFEQTPLDDRGQKDNEDHEVGAAILPVEGQRMATMWVCKGFVHLDEDLIRHFLIHEMLHLHHRDSTEPLRTLGNLGVMSQASYLVLYEAHRLQIEIMVDQLAYAFDPFIKARDRKLMKAIKETAHAH